MAAVVALLGALLLVVDSADTPTGPRPAAGQVETPIGSRSAAEGPADTPTGPRAAAGQAGTSSESPAAEEPAGAHPPIRLADTVGSIAQIELRHGDRPVRLHPDPQLGLRPDYPFDVTYDPRRIERLAGSVLQLPVHRIIRNYPSLADYGLADPATRVHVTMTDGTERLLEIGDPTPDRRNRYVREPSGSQIAIVPATSVEPFLFSLDDFRSKELPTFDPAGLQRVRILTQEGREFEIARPAGRDLGPEFWFSAFAVRGSLSRPYPANLSWMESFTQDYRRLHIDRYVDDDPGSLEPYGLDPPATVLEIESRDRTITLRIGDRAEAGRYATLDPGRSVFLIVGADSLLNVGPLDVVSPFVMSLNIADVESISVTGPGGTVAGSRGADAGQDEESAGQDEANAGPGGQYTLAIDRTGNGPVYRVAGGVVPEEVFLPLYERIISLRFDAPNPAGVPENAGDDRSQYRVRYQLQDRASDGQAAVEINFVPVDGTYLAVVRDGTSDFLISRAQVERVVNAIASAAGN